MNLLRARSALSRSKGAASTFACASLSSIMRSRAFFNVSSRSFTSAPRRGGQDGLGRSRRRCKLWLPGDFVEISLDIVTKRASAALITVHIWPLSVTESLELPPQNGAVAMSGIQKFDLREWL